MEHGGRAMGMLWLGLGWSVMGWYGKGWYGLAGKGLVWFGEQYVRYAQLGTTHTDQDE